MSTGQGWNVDGLVNLELCLQAQLLLPHNGPVECLQYCGRCINLRVHLMLHFPITSELDPKILLVPNPDMKHANSYRLYQL